MHLKSTNGAIDVLVCPEDEPQSQHLQSPHPVPYISTTSSESCATTPNYSVLEQQPYSPELDSVVMAHQVQVQSSQEHAHCSMGQVSCVKLEEGLRQEQAVGIILDQSAVAPSYPSPAVTGLGPPNSELDISLSSTADINDDLGFMDRLLPIDTAIIDTAMFDHLSPTLQTDDFSFSMDNSTEGIHDLFDL